MNTPNWSENHFRLTAPNTITAVPVVQAFVRNCAWAMGFRDADLARLELVTEELSINILQHAYNSGEPESFTIDCIIGEDRIEIVFSDQGRPFDPETIGEFKGVDPTTFQAPPGLGLYLAARLVDVFQVRNLGAKGKEVRLIKRLQGSWKEAAEPAGFRQTHRTCRPEDFEAIQIRTMQPEEAVEVSRLIYEVYRYTYMSDSPYNPQSLRRMQAEGRLHPYVAVLGNGVIASHIALIHSPDMPTLGEIGMAATLTAARGQKLIGKLGMAVFQKAIDLGLAGVYANFTTAHRASQRAKQQQTKLGVPVGFLPARTPETVQYKHIIEEAPQRISTLLMYQGLTARTPATVHLQDQHREFIADIYQNCGIPVEPDTARHPLPDVSTQIEITIEQARNLANLSVPAAGKDFPQQLNVRLFGLRLNKIPVVFAFLNLFDPHTPVVADIMEQSGFFGTGILPGGMRGGDALLMACLLGCAIDYDRIELVDQASRDLLAYVKRQDPLYRKHTDAD